MGTKVSETGGGDFSPCPAGLHRAVCIAYIDLGTQSGPKYMCPGETVWQQKVAIMWETPDEVLEVDGEHKPYAICKFYTKSLSPKANLTADLESWRGRPFTDAERKEFDLDNILGAVGQVNVIHETKNNKVKAKVIGVLPLSKGMMKPTPSIKPWRYDVYENFKKFPPEMSEGFMKMILKCREMTEVAPAQDTPCGDGSGLLHEDTVAHDEIPF